MKITKHGNSLTQLTRFPNFFPMNCYFVCETDGLTVVDSTMPGAAKEILAAAHAIGLPIKRILITHSHADHVGSLDQLHAAVPDAEVLLTHRQDRILRGDQSPEPGEPSGKVRGSYMRRTTTTKQFYAPGDRIGSLLAVAAPGHTPDQVAFLDTRDSSLICGDSFQTITGIGVTGTFRIGFPWISLATWSRAVGVETARALVGLTPSRLAAGHGNVLESPVAAMTEAITVEQSNLAPTHGTQIRA